MKNRFKSSEFRENLEKAENRFSEPPFFFSLIDEQVFCEGLRCI